MFIDLMRGQRGSNQHMHIIATPIANIFIQRKYIISTSYYIIYIYSVSMFVKYAYIPC